MATATKTLRVFIASPGGLQKERKTFRDVVEEFNRSDALPRGLHFVPVGWEDTLETAGRPQELINRDLEKCDTASSFCGTGGARRRAAAKGHSRLAPKNSALKLV